MVMFLKLLVNKGSIPVVKRAKEKDLRHGCCLQNGEMRVDNELPDRNQAQQ